MTRRTAAAVALVAQQIVNGGPADLARAFPGPVTGAEGRAVLGSAGSGNP